MNARSSRPCLSRLPKALASSEQYAGGLELLQQDARSNKPRIDVIDLVLADNLRACDQGLLRDIEHKSLAKGPGGEKPKTDFLPGGLPPCGVAQSVYATVLAFDVAAFAGHKPTSVEALFDIRRFPGKRALQRRPIALLEWALLSYGVPHQQLYSLLSTERGINLAFKRLDVIREHIIWWENPEQPARWLMDGTATMASGYNGRFFNAVAQQGADIQILWDGQLYDYATWGIPRTSPNPKLARQFVQFVTQSQQLAALTQHISYGPARESAMGLVWQHAENHMDMRPHLPTYPPHFQRAIRLDHRWYARMQETLEQRFAQWLSSSADTPPDTASPSGNP